MPRKKKNGAGLKPTPFLCVRKSYCCGAGSSSPPIRLVTFST
jgi:hypothetical protein